MSAALRVTLPPTQQPPASASPPSQSSSGRSQPNQESDHATKTSTQQTGHKEVKSDHRVPTPSSASCFRSHSFSTENASITSPRNGEQPPDALLFSSHPHLSHSREAVEEEWERTATVTNGPNQAPSPVSSNGVFVGQDARPELLRRRYSSNVRAIPRDYPSGCRYKCLEPLLPALEKENVLPASIACDLLDAYFTEPGTSLFQCASPYVLTPIIRKKSLLHPINPRPTTPALLCTMLWCAAQTAEITLLQTPGARTKVLNTLYNLSVSLIMERDPDGWRRVHGMPFNPLIRYMIADY